MILVRLIAFSREDKESLEPLLDDLRKVRIEVDVDHAIHALFRLGFPEVHSWQRPFNKFICGLRKHELLSKLGSCLPISSDIPRTQQDLVFLVVVFLAIAHRHPKGVVWRQRSERGHLSETLVEMRETIGS